MLDSPVPSDESPGGPTAGFDPLGLRQDDRAAREPPTLDVTLTMPRVRLGAPPPGDSPAPHPAESDLWTHMQQAAQLARIGKAQAALTAFNETCVKARSYGEPALAVIAAKASYNRAVILEKLLGDVAGAEAEMERIHDAFGGHALQEARTVAGRAGLHAARLAALGGQLAVAMSRYRDRLGRFRDVLPPAELQTFHVDYLKQRAAAKERGLEVTTRLTILPSSVPSVRGLPTSTRPAPNEGSNEGSFVDPHPIEIDDSRIVELRTRHEAAQARIAAELEKLRHEARGQNDAMRREIGLVEQRLGTTRAQLEARQDRLFDQWQRRHDELRADQRRRLRALRSELQRVASEQRATRLAMMGVVLAGFVGICFALWMFQHSLAIALAPLLKG